MLHVYSLKKHVAMIGKPPKCADAYVKETPWCLLHNSGRVDRFATEKEAKQEAIKTYPATKITRKDI